MKVSSSIKMTDQKDYKKANIYTYYLYTLHTIQNQIIFIIK